MNRNIPTNIWLRSSILFKPNQRLIFLFSMTNKG